MTINWQEMLFFRNPKGIRQCLLIIEMNASEIFFCAFHAYMRTDAGVTRGLAYRDVYAGTDEKRHIGSS